MFKFYLTPLGKGSKKINNYPFLVDMCFTPAPFGERNVKKIQMLRSIAQKKGLNARITKQKNKTHFDGLFWKKFDLTIDEVHKNWTNVLFFLLFSKFGHQTGPVFRVKC